MVYYFTSNTVTPSAFIYVGKDKVESKTPLPLMLPDDISSTSGHTLLLSSMRNNEFLGSGFPIILQIYVVL